jgi:hypothetical protein
MTPKVVLLAAALAGALWLGDRPGPRRRQRLCTGSTGYM